MEIISTLIVIGFFVLAVYLATGYDEPKSTDSTQRGSRLCDSETPFIDVEIRDDKMFLWRFEPALDMAVEYIGSIEAYNVVEFRNLITKYTKIESLSFRENMFDDERFVKMLNGIYGVSV